MRALAQLSTSQEGASPSRVRCDLGHICHALDNIFPTLGRQEVDAGFAGLSAPTGQIGSPFGVKLPAAGRAGIRPRCPLPVAQVAARGRHVTTRPGLG
jgi:hypothetical protein